MTIDFTKEKHQFDTITVNSQELELVSSIKKVNKRLYFLILLKRAHVNARDIINFYFNCIRPVHCAPVFHHALPEYLSNDLERVQKQALSIISPRVSYMDNLTTHNISALKDRLCKKLFHTVVSDTHHKLYHLLPAQKNFCI